MTKSNPHSSPCATTGLQHIKIKQTKAMKHSISNLKHVKKIQGKQIKMWNLDWVNWRFEFFVLVRTIGYSHCQGIHFVNVMLCLKKLLFFFYKCWIFVDCQLVVNSGWACYLGKWKLPRNWSCGNENVPKVLMIPITMRKWMCVKHIRGK